MLLTGTATSTAIDASTSVFVFDFGSASDTPLSSQIYVTNGLLIIMVVFLGIDLLRRIFGKHSM